ncbi:sugar phosphate isomerase/epimerase [Paremcibacter congregatus]|uniref:sugar phosphate isomerase/epimerase family protein n=1 Tax=Paremcibacter congregatus TaxID=2043170 RepID=UPI0030EC8702
MSHLTRRTMMKAGAALGLAGLCAPMFTPAFAHRVTIPKVGLQLYTVRDLMAQDVAGTLQQVAALGYQEVEFAGYFGHSAQDIRHMLDQTGLSSPSVHVELEDLQGDLDLLIEQATTIGQKYIVMSWLRPEQRQTLDQFKSYATLFNKVGERFRAAGLQLAYHNHAFEFEPLDGEMPYDLLLRDCPADLMQMELDLYWIYQAGQDPFDYFARHPGRFPLCHVKDRAADGSITEVGQGAIDFGRIFAAQELAGLKHFYVEHDEPGNALLSITTSMKTMKQWRA